MISIRKYLDQDSDILLASALSAYRAVLLAMADSCMAGDPAASLNLRNELITIISRLPESLTEKDLEKSQADVTENLEEWGRCTVEHLQHAACEVKHLLIALAGTADAVGLRDRNYVAQLSELTSRLETIAQLDDVLHLRQSVMESAGELKNCVSQIAKEGEECIKRFQAEISNYEIRLHESEQRTVRDSLTGLFNRRGVEKILTRRIAEHRPFSFVMVDLDDFKSVNDLYGHLAGDDLLKQFAAELRLSARSGDVLARWGGDEFVLILDCGPSEASALLRRMDSWVGGEYLISSGETKHTVTIKASFGVAGWEPGDSIHDVLLRADKAMYLKK
jgi:diguanylate cyclase (GGDEF)-like protein